MSRRPRRNHTAAFKAKVALAALKGEKTLLDKARWKDHTLTVHQRGLHRAAKKERYPDQHGRQGLLARQCLRGADLENDQVRRGVPQGLRIGSGSENLPGEIHRVLQPDQTPLQPERKDTQSGPPQPPARNLGSLTKTDPPPKNHRNLFKQTEPPLLTPYAGRLSILVNRSLN